MFYPPRFRLKVVANLARGSPLYVLALEGVSIVAALYHVSSELALTFSDVMVDMHESEYASALVAMLFPMAHTTHLLPPDSEWDAHATLRVHTKRGVIDDYGTEGEAAQLAFSVHDRGYPEESLDWLTPQERFCAMDAIEEERTFIRTLDGFLGDCDKLLWTLTAYLDGSAALAKAELFRCTAHHAELALFRVYEANEVPGSVPR